VNAANAQLARAAKGPADRARRTARPAAKKKRKTSARR